MVQDNATRKFKVRNRFGAQGCPPAQYISYTYDQLNRLTLKSYPDSTTVNYTSRYSVLEIGLKNCDSRLTQVSDSTGT
jgi:uncharacterized protein RhaS with RHS repeats